ncbi:uncharacterized protein SCHCODRAFT_02639664 [Schizophyllum commune H4-8]|uniref:uncharacterized protein n=1 Tax=Schizophyllum commune (strain H4-8 / FGSC 9210) TaxID=578458 RepID=UPI00216036AB|nr:uncharacterized protein SCHCODRAFT_02639664 [Schizophyllum commune H4-8]KAI5888076.1 hypothetical protein SCHCODRAFT_02639664 [Schizophyllum commune H4-8]
MSDNKGGEPRCRHRSFSAMFFVLAGRAESRCLPPKNSPAQRPATFPSFSRSSSSSNLPVSPSRIQFALALVSRLINNSIEIR